MPTSEKTYSFFIDEKSRKISYRTRAANENSKSGRQIFEFSGEQPFRKYLLSGFKKYLEDNNTMLMELYEEMYFNFIRAYYKNIKSEPSLPEHMTGILYMANYLSTVYRTCEQFLGVEINISKPKKPNDTTQKFIKPDVIILNTFKNRDTFLLLEVQNNGRISSDKLELLKEVSESVDNLGAIYVAFKDRSEDAIDAILDDLKNNGADEFIDAVGFFPGKIDLFFSNVSDRYLSNLVKVRSLL